MKEDEMKYFTRMFEEIMQELREPPKQRGFCSCCFLDTVGNFAIYQYADRTKVQLFICDTCMEKCRPEEPCKVEGCNFMETHDKYVTNENKKSSFK